MRTKAYYINRKNLKSKFSTDVIREIRKSKYGFYSQGTYGAFCSEKATLEDGFEIERLTRVELGELEILVNRKKEKLERQAKKEKLQERFNQIEICLKSTPLPIEKNTGGNPLVSFVINLSDTPMIEAYHGCGEGTAYLNEDNKLIAFHYGYEKPKNAPKSYTVQVALSSTQIIF